MRLMLFLLLGLHTFIDFHYQTGTHQVVYWLIIDIELYRFQIYTQLNNCGSGAFIKSWKEVSYLVHNDKLFIWPAIKVYGHWDNGPISRLILRITVKHLRWGILVPPFWNWPFSMNIKGSNEGISFECWNVVVGPVWAQLTGYYQGHYICKDDRSFKYWTFFSIGSCPLHNEIISIIWQLLSQIYIFWELCSLHNALYEVDA